MKIILRRRILIKLILLSLFSVTVVICLMSKEQELLGDFKHLLEIEMESVLSRDVEIQNISGGIFTPIILKNIKVSYTKDSQSSSLLTIEQIKVNRRIWDPLFTKKRLLGKLVLRVNNANLSLFGDFGPKIKKQNGIIILDKKQEYLTVDLANDFYHFRAKVTNIYEDQFLDIKLKMKSQLADGEIIIKGTSKSPDIRGDLSLFGLTKIILDNVIKIEEGKVFLKDLVIQDKFLTKGKIDLNSKEASIIIQSEGEDKIKITLSSINNNRFLGLIEINHLKINEHDVVANFKLDLSIDRDKNNRFQGIKGRISTNTCILDYKPLEDLSGTFSYSNDSLLIDSIKLGNNCNLSGIIFLGEPEIIDIEIEINEVRVENLDKFFFIPKEFDFSSESISGKITVKGNLEDPEIKIHITSREGHMQDIEFESVSVTLEGTYPILMVKDSRINRMNSYLLVEGRVDLRKIKSDNLFEDLLIKTDEETIIWEGWDITRRRNDPEVSLKKEVGDEVNIFYRGYLDDETAPKEESDKDTIELEYKLWDNKSLKMRLKEGEEFFGIENKLKF